MNSITPMTTPSTFIPEEIQQHLGSGDAFQQIMHMQGQVFRDVRGRKTIMVELGGNRYFIKQHFGVGWKEIFKNLVTFRRPIIGAKTEMLAIRKLDEIGIATTPFVAFGEKGSNPATLRSFLITKDLGDIISLEELAADWQNSPPDMKLKRQLIIAVARLARNLHANGMNHRDFYLCHLCLDAKAFSQSQIKLYLIDLHRMQIHHKPYNKGNMKDIAALYFSSLDTGLSVRDYLRFKHYYGKGLTGDSSSFWQDVVQRANGLYKKFHSDKFQKRLQLEKGALKNE